MFIIIVRELESAAFLTNLNLIGRLLFSPCYGKMFSNLILFHIDSQHLFVQCHAAKFVSASSGKMDHVIIFDIKSVLNHILLLIFTLHII